MRRPALWTIRLDSKNVSGRDFLYRLVECPRCMDVAKAQVLGDVVHGELATHPGQTEERGNLRCEGDFVALSRPIERAGPRGVAGQPKGLTLLVPEGKSEGAIELVEEVRSALGESSDQVVQSSVIEATVHDQDMSLVLEGLTSLAARCAEPSMDQNGRSAMEGSLVIPSPVGHASGELMALVSVG